MRARLLRARPAAAARLAGVAAVVSLCACAGARAPAAARCEAPPCPEPALPVCPGPWRAVETAAARFGDRAPPDGTRVRVRAFLHRVATPAGCRLRLEQPFGTRPPVIVPLACAPDAPPPCCGAFIPGQLAIAEGVAEGGAIRVASLCVVPQEIAPAGPVP